MQRIIPIRCAALAAAITVTMAFSSCSRENDAAEDMTYNGSYHKIEGGTSVLVENEQTDIPEDTIYIPEDMETIYGQSFLSAEEKEIYSSLVKAIKAEEASVPMDADGETYTKILNLIGIEQMGIANVADRKVGSFDMDTQRFPVEFTYRFSREEMSSMNRAAENAANEIMSGLTDEMTSYDKLKYFHDYLITHCESSANDIYANTIYGALVKGKSLCEGYAKSFSYLCNKAGIENIIVTGQTDTAHMWNMVKINGNWYHVDVTWDKPEKRISNAYPDMVLYQYFLVTDSVIENNHTIWTITSPPPKAYGTTENYYIKEGFYADSEDITESIIEAAIRNAVSEGKHTASVKFSTNNMLLTTVGSLIDSAEDEENYLKSKISEISSEFNVKLNVSWTDYYSQYRILMFIIDY
ncbi:MAG: transglutaminase domain-containing protein [Oscillospiraceae bacterium]